MKLFASICATFMLFTPTSVDEIALRDSRVVEVESVSYMGEWYIALITEPIYFRSEINKLCEDITEDIHKYYGTKAYVSVDVGLYHAIKEAKNSPDISQKLSYISKIFKSRCDNERNRYYQS